MISTLRRGLLVLLAALPLMANAAAGGSAHDLVQDTTNKMLADLTANKEQYKQDPTRFYEALNTIVGPVVDAEGISRSIMTVKYSRKATLRKCKHSRKTSRRACSSSTATPCWSTTTKVLPSPQPGMSRVIAPALT